MRRNPGFSTIAWLRVQKRQVRERVAEPDKTLRNRILRWARTIRRDVVALWIAARDPRVPWYAKAVCAAIAAYALSPIDLIPDIIPVLGYLDEVILLPLAILLAVRLVPPTLMAEFRAQADLQTQRPVSRRAAAFIVIVWIAASVLLLWLVWPSLPAGWNVQTPTQRH